MTTESNACVLVTGIYPAYLSRENLLQSIDQIKTKFHKYDVYWQSWDNETNREILEPLGLDILWVEQPEIRINPYLHLFELGWMGKILEAKYRRFGGGDAKTRKITNRTLQHLAHAAIVESLPKKYDIHIRTRWDIYISDSFSADEWVALAKDRPVGFGFQTLTKKIVPDPAEVRKGREYGILSKRRKVRELIDSGWHNVMRGVEDETDRDYWQYMIYDFLLMYSSDRFDPKRVYELHEVGELCPAEYGWYQLLNTNNDHINVNGLVGTRRIVDDDMETLVKLIQSGEL